MIRLYSWMVVLVWAATIAPEANAFSSGPPDGRAGDPPGFNDCTGCHSSFPLNSGDGLLTLDGVPSSYVPDTVYPLTVTITDDPQIRWGFEATAIAVNVDEGGELAPTDANSQLSGTPGDGTRDYIKHTSVGTQMGESFGTWDIEWKAPPAGSGDVDFYVAGNAANGNGNNQGDYIYTIRLLSEEGVVDVGETPAVAATILRAFPNPLRTGALTVSFDLEHDDDVGLLVIDAAGRLVETVAPRAYTAGAVEIAVPTTSLRPGRYWVRAAGGFGIKTAPLTVIR